MTKISLHTINKYFQGVRSINTPKGRKVLAATQQLIASRKALLDDAADDQPELPFSKDAA